VNLFSAMLNWMKCRFKKVLVDWLRLLISYKERQRAVLIKTLVLGIKPSLKPELYRDA
jgi:hypothetical protein